MQREAPPRPERLRLRLVTGDSVTIARSELLPVLRHRLSLFYFTAVVSLLILLNLRGADRNMANWQDAVFYVALKIGALIFVTAVLTVLRLRARATPVVPIHLSFLTVFIALAMVTANEAAVWLRDGALLPTPALYVGLFILYWVLTEVEILIFCTLVLPRILRDLRMRAPLDPPAPPVRPEPASQILIGDLAIDAGTVRHVRAEGNYVEIRTDTDRHYLLATFSTVVAGLEQQDGQQIHRSHWIAARVLTGFYRDGRDIIVRLEDGTEIAVAQSRQKELLPWLQSVTVRL